MANRIPQQVLDDKKTVIRLDLSNAEFHLLFETLWGLCHSLSGDMSEAVEDQVAAMKWADKIGPDGVDEFLVRLNKIHEATCPGYKESEHDS